jgi:pyruvate/2-oxoglutarate dehydrogenase complex dihydrolipoamide dehydrogenase (E3) component
MTETLTPDICVIGAGAGGLSVAAAAAAFGVPVVLIEKGKMGGDCLNVGCVPSKALIAAARRAHEGRTGATFGTDVAGIAVSYPQVRRHVHDVIAAIAPNDSAARFAGLGVRVLSAEARFLDPQTVAADDRWLVRARRFVIATGSVPAIPPIPGLDQTPYLTNETIFDLEECPSHLIVIGGGPIGLELAQAYRRLGARVTVLDAAIPLAKEDAECARVVLDCLAGEGIALRSDIRISRAARAGEGVQITVDGRDGDEVIGGSHLLVAAGRRAMVEGLDLDKAGIATGPTGIMVNKALRTSNRRVYAIGDAIGGPQFTHVANYHAGLVVRNALFRLPVRVKDVIVPRVTFTDPELAHVGFTEKEARDRFGEIRVLRWPFHDNDRAQTERDTVGHIKIVTTKRGRILGATIVGAQAGELISTWALALARGLNIRAMAACVLPYPTRAEAGKRAAIEFFAAGLTNPHLRRIIALLRRFG